MKKTEKKFKLGKLQKYWIKQLRNHPERQLDGSLGNGNPRKYQACCLGELHLCAFRLAKKKLPFVDNVIMCGSSDGYLDRNWEKYGLRSDSGKLLKKAKIRTVEFWDLATANDQGVTWTEIADYIKQNPENVFTKSV